MGEEEGIRFCPRCLYPQLQASLYPYYPSYSPDHLNKARTKTALRLIFYMHVNEKCFKYNKTNKSKNKDYVTTAAMD